MPLREAVTRLLPRPRTTLDEPLPAAAPANRLQAWIAGAGGSPQRQHVNPATLLIAGVLNILGAVLFGFVAQFTILGTLEHNRDQGVAYDDLRLAMAEGTAPVGPLEGKPLERGAPVARLTIREIGLKEVVLEGTTSHVLRSGVGHRRDTVLPGQIGTSVLMGRRMAFGGPFSEIGTMAEDSEIKVVTGQGEAIFKVVGVRRAGDPQPQPLPAGGARLTMITTDGSRFAPKDVLRVDADLVGKAFDPAPPAFTAVTLPENERVLEGQPGALGAVTGWGFLLTCAALGVTVLRLRWGRWQAWLVAVPVLAFLGLETGAAVACLLPNLF